MPALEKEGEIILVRSDLVISTAVTAAKRGVEVWFSLVNGFLFGISTVVNVHSVSFQPHVVFFSSTLSGVSSGGSGGGGGERGDSGRVITGDEVGVRSGEAMDLRDLIDLLENEVLEDALDLVSKSRSESSSSSELRSVLSLSASVSASAS